MNPHRLSVADSVPYHDALAQCVDHWGLVAEETTLVRDGVNHVFASVQGRGQPVIVRVSDGSVRDRSEIEGELIWLDHLRKNGCTVSTPVRSLNGHLLETIALPKGIFHVSCFVRFGGRQLDPRTDPEWNHSFLEKLGREIGRVHRVSDTLTLPPDHDRKPWYASNLSQFPSPLPNGFNPSVCDAMQAFIDELRTRPMKPRHYGLVHRDLHSGNFLYEHGRIELIDFDLGCYGWRTMDFVALLFGHYFYPSLLVPDASPARVREVLAAMVRGYRYEYTLDREQLDMIEDLLKLRTIINYVAMAPDPDRWQVAIGDPTPTVRESLAWIENRWIDSTPFGVDVRGL